MAYHLSRVRLYRSVAAATSALVLFTAALFVAARHFAL
jgi:hypothetical protein